MSASPEHRHQCEVRKVLQLRSQDRQRAVDYLVLVTKRRGEAAGEQLQTDAANQWALGNRGAEGQWK